MIGVPKSEPKHARVRHGERAALDLLGLQPLRTGALGQVLRGAGEAEDRLLVGVLDDRDDEAPVEGHGHPEVDVLVVDDVLAVDRGVDLRKLRDRLDRGAEDERQVRQLDAVLRQELVLVLRAEPGDVRVVDLEDGRDVRRGPLREDHVLGGDPPDLGHRDDFVALGHRDRRARRRSFGRLGAADHGSLGRRGRAPDGRLRDLAVLEVGENVVLRDAVVDAGALDLGDVDRVFLGDLADERRGLAADALLDRLDLAAGLGAGSVRGAGAAGAGAGAAAAGARGGRPGPPRGPPPGSSGRRRRRPSCRSRRRCRPGPRAAAVASAAAGRGWRRSLGDAGADAACSPASPIVADDRVDRHRLALVDLDLEKRPRDRGGDLGVDLVGRDLEDRLVALDRVADFLEPLGDGALGDGLAHLGHDDRRRHGILPRSEQHRAKASNREVREPLHLSAFLIPASVRDIQ